MSLSEDIGFVRGVLRGILMDPEGFRLHAITDGIAALDRGIAEVERLQAMLVTCDRHLRETHPGAFEAAERELARRERLCWCGHAEREHVADAPVCWGHMGDAACTCRRYAPEPAQTPQESPERP